MEFRHNAWALLRKRLSRKPVSAVRQFCLRGRSRTVRRVPRGSARAIPATRRAKHEMGERAYVRREGLRALGGHERFRMVAPHYTETPRGGGAGAGAWQASGAKLNPVGPVSDLKRNV